VAAVGRRINRTSENAASGKIGKIDAVRIQYLK
jgi:hypothetical protein